MLKLNSTSLVANTNGVDNKGEQPTWCLFVISGVKFKRLVIIFVDFPTVRERANDTGTECLLRRGVAKPHSHRDLVRRSIARSLVLLEFAVLLTSSTARGHCYQPWLCISEISSH